MIKEALDGHVIHNASQASVYCIGVIGADKGYHGVPILIIPTCLAGGTADQQLTIIQALQQSM